MANAVSCLRDASRFTYSSTRQRKNDVALTGNASQRRDGEPDRRRPKRADQRNRREILSALYARRFIDLSRRRWTEAKGRRNQISRKTRRKPQRPRQDARFD